MVNIPLCSRETVEEDPRDNDSVGSGVPHRKGAEKGCTGKGWSESARCRFRGGAGRLWGKLQAICCLDQIMLGGTSGSEAPKSNTQCSQSLLAQHSKFQASIPQN